MKNILLSLVLLPGLCLSQPEQEAPGGEAPASQGPSSSAEEPGGQAPAAQGPNSPAGLVRFDCDDIWQWPDDIGNRADYIDWYASNCNECRSSRDDARLQAWKALNCAGPGCADLWDEFTEVRGEAYSSEGKTREEMDQLDSRRNELWEIYHSACVSDPVEGIVIPADILGPDG